MPTNCVGKNRCSSHAPGWLSTSHPSVADGIVSGRVCFHWDSSCCNWYKDIRVRNCGGFYVYELGPTPTCELRYCGNGGGKDVLLESNGVAISTKKTNSRTSKGRTNTHTETERLRLKQADRHADIGIRSGSQ